MSLWITCLSWWRYNSPSKTWFIKTLLMLDVPNCSFNFQQMWQNLNILNAEVKAETMGQAYTYLLAKYCEVWLQNGFNLFNYVCKRSAIHVFQNKIYYTIVVKRLMAKDYMWALCCLIYFELLYYLFANWLLNVHLNALWRNCNSQLTDRSYGEMPQQYKDQEERLKTFNRVYIVTWCILMH